MATMVEFRFWEMVFNEPLVAAVASMASAQLFKTLKPIASGKRPDFRKIAHYGGWPSGHTAFIVSCALAVGLVEGFGSSLFAVAAVLAGYLVYDILKMRRVVSLDGREIDRLLERAAMERVETSPQFEGHSVSEILGGIAWGCAWAVAVCLIY